MTRYPSLYFKLLKNRLIPPGDLNAALADFYEKTGGDKIGSEGGTVRGTEEKRIEIASQEEGNDEDETSFVLELDHRRETEETQSDETVFILDNQEDTDSTITSPEPEGLKRIAAEEKAEEESEPTADPDELDKRFLAELESEGLLNHWQVTQLLHGRSRFHLGRYRIVDSLGAGGYGYVFLARTDDDPSNLGVSDSSGHRPYDVAVKVLPHSESNPRRLARFLREIEINRQLSHPNLVRFMEAGEGGKVHYAVYEYMDGKTARQLDHQVTPVDGRTAAYVIYETAKALYYLHQKGFIHRDIKPGNILFSKEGDVKLGDLGLATPLVGGEFLPKLGTVADAPDELDASGRQIAGTSDYLSPDQIRHPTRPNVLWDIYSLGCTLYFLVTGIVPFPSGSAHQKLSAHLKSDAPDPKMFNPGISWDLSRLIMEMMDKDPRKRPADAEEVCRRLRPLIGTKQDLKEFFKRRKSAEKISKLVFPKKEFNWNEFMTDDADFLAAVESSADGGAEPNLESVAVPLNAASEESRPCREDRPSVESRFPVVNPPSDASRSESVELTKTSELHEDLSDEFAPSFENGGKDFDSENFHGPPDKNLDRAADSAALSIFELETVRKEGRLSLSPLSGTEIDGELFRLEKMIRHCEHATSFLKWSLIPLAAAFLAILFFWRTRF